MCVEQCCTFDDVVEPEECLVVPSRGIGSAARRERWCTDVKLVPLERVQQRIDEQLVEIPVR